MALASSTDYYASASAGPSASSSGIVNRVATLFNRLGSGVSGNAPDLTSPPLFTTIYGPKFRATHTGSRGAIYFDANERGLSTPPPSLTLATPGAMVTGDACTVSSTGTLPTLQYGQMSASTTYYLIKQADGTFLFATSATAASEGNFSPLVAPGTGTLTISDTTQSLTSTATINWFGIPMSTGQLYSFFDVVTIDRWRLRQLGSQRGGDNANATWQSIASAGNVWLGLGGKGNSTVNNVGRLAMAINGLYNGQIATESATLGLATGIGSYDSQTLFIARVMQASGGSAGSSYGSVKHYVNGVLSTQQGDKYVAPSAPLSQICIGDGAAWMRSPWRSGHHHHYSLIFSGQLTTADIAGLQAAFNARMLNSASRASARAARTAPWIMGTGQSNRDNRNGNTNQAGYSGTVTTPGGLVLVNGDNRTGQNSALQVGEDVWAQLTGAPGCTDYSRNMNGGGLSAATTGRTLLGSELPWTSSTVVNTTATGFVDDCSASVTPGTPSTYQLDTHSGSAGANLAAYITACQTLGTPTPAGIAWTQGENSVYGWNLSSTNRSVSGSPFASYTLEQLGGKTVEGLGLLQGFITAAWGVAASSPLPFGIQHIPTVSGGTPAQHSVLMAAYQIYVDQNPNKALLVNANPWHHTGFPQLHYQSWAYEYLQAEETRVWTWWFKQLGTLYTEGTTGPAYGQFPRVQAMSAVAGNSFVDVTVTNPNGATSLILSSSAPTLGWSVRTGTVTTAISTAGAVAGSALSGAAGTYEKGGTALSITGASLIAPFKVRLALSAALVAGTKVALFYADAIALDGNNTNSYPKSPDSFQNMLTDSSGVDFATADTLMRPFYRGRHMPVAIEACGLAVTP